MSTEFDREINVRGVIWTGLALVAVALVVHLLIWWLLRGFGNFDEKRDVHLTPIEQASPQQPPPEPRLQVAPVDDMRAMREDEDHRLQTAGWVDRQQGIVRVPIDVAIDVVAARGVAPVVVGGTGAAQKPSPPQPSSPGGRGGRTPTQRQVPLSPPGREGSGE